MSIGLLEAGAFQRPFLDCLRATTGSPGMALSTNLQGSRPPEHSGSAVKSLRPPLDHLLEPASPPQGTVLEKGATWTRSTMLYLIRMLGGGSPRLPNFFSFGLIQFHADPFQRSGRIRCVSEKA